MQLKKLKIPNSSVVGWPWLALAAGHIILSLPLLNKTRDKIRWTKVKRNRSLASHYQMQNRLNLGRMNMIFLWFEIDLSSGSKWKQWDYPSSELCPAVCWLEPGISSQRPPYNPSARPGQLHPGPHPNSLISWLREGSPQLSVPAKTFQNQTDLLLHLPTPGMELRIGRWRSCSCMGW